jgi:hypothetical protein
MKPILKLTLLTMTVIFATGCTTAYWADRRADLTDVAHVDTHAWSMGLAANVGPAVLGWHLILEDQGPGHHGIYGLGGYQESGSDGVAAGLIIPLSWREEHGRSRVLYNKISPTWGSVGIDFGWLLGFGARIDFVELIDLILGFGGIDILNDDLERQKKLGIEQDSSADAD